RTGEKSLAVECLRQERADVGEGVIRLVDDRDLHSLDAGAVRQTGETTTVQRLIGRGLHLDLTARHREADVDREVDDGHVAGAAPPPANVFGELPPTLPQETKAWTKLLWNFPAFFGCWNAHCACALAEKPTTNAAAARPPTSCLIMGYPPSYGWLGMAIRTDAGAVHDTPERRSFDHHRLFVQRSASQDCRSRSRTRKDSRSVDQET